MQTWTVRAALAVVAAATAVPATAAELTIQSAERRLMTRTNVQIEPPEDLSQAQSFPGSGWIDEALVGHPVFPTDLEIVAHQHSLVDASGVFVQASVDGSLTHAGGDPTMYGDASTDVVVEFGLTLISGPSKLRLDIDVSKNASFLPGVGVVQLAFRDAPEPAVLRFLEWEETEISEHFVFWSRNIQLPGNLYVVIPGAVYGADGMVEVGHCTATVRLWPARCIADLNLDNQTTLADLGELFNAWGTAAADLDGDGTTSLPDLALLLSEWGCSETTPF